MPTKTFTLTLTDDVAAASLAPATASELNRQIVADRVRTIDQLKRLYAVVMGFAVTQCFTHIYGCAQSIHLFSVSGLILFAQGISFITLIVLFYLGAERLFDNRYLRPKSGVPHPIGLLIDIITTGITAIWFVVLADTFADPAFIKPPETIESAISTNFHYFIVNLLLLYSVDAVFLLIQIVHTHLYKDRISDYQKSINHHYIWLALNVAGMVLFYPVVVNFTGNEIAQLISNLVPDAIAGIFTNDKFLACYIIVLHTARFIADYWYAYHSYYPPDELVVV
jgi:hypothetical protein